MYIDPIYKFLYIAVYFVIFMIEGIIIFQYCIHILKPKYSYVINLGFLFVIYLILFIIFLFHNAMLNAISFVVFNILYIVIVYDIHFFQACFHSITLGIIMNFGEYISIFISPYMKMEFKENYTVFSLITMVILSKLIYFFIVRILIMIYDNGEKEVFFSFKQAFLINLVPLLSFIIFFPITYTSSIITVPFKVTLFFSISSIAILALNLVIYNVFYYIAKQNKIYTRLQLQVQHDNDIANYYNHLKLQDEQQKILIHDIKNHLQTLYELNENKNYEKVNNYLNIIMNLDALKPSIKISNNTLLNAIINRYMEKARLENIDFHCEIRNKTIDFLTDYELTSFICNLLDNGFTAASCVQNSFVELLIYPSINQQICVSLINSCLNNPFANHNNKLYTTKVDNKHHGFGLKSVKKIISNHNGLMNMHYDKNDSSFHTTILFCETSLKGKS